MNRWQRPGVLFGIGSQYDGDGLVALNDQSQNPPQPSHWEGKTVKNNGMGEGQFGYFTKMSALLHAQHVVTSGCVSVCGPLKTGIDIIYHRN